MPFTGCPEKLEPEIVLYIRPEGKTVDSIHSHSLQSSLLSIVLRMLGSRLALSALSADSTEIVTVSRG